MFSKHSQEIYKVISFLKINQSMPQTPTTLALNYKCHTTLGIHHCWIAGSGMFTGYLLKKKI
jgi:hypothetical protein